MVNLLTAWFFYLYTVTGTLLDVVLFRICTLFTDTLPERRGRKEVSNMEDIKKLIAATSGLQEQLKVAVQKLDESRDHKAGQGLLIFTHISTSYNTSI